MFIITITYLLIVFSKAVELFQLVGIIWLRFRLFQKWSNYSNSLELSDWYSVYFKSGQVIPTYWNYLIEIQFISVYFRSGQIIPTYWNYLTEIQFISEVVKLFQLIGIIWLIFSLFQNWSNYSNLSSKYGLLMSLLKHTWRL